MRLHPRAAGLYLTLDPRWRDKLWRGGLVLLIPTLGWPAVLGYRSAVVRSFFGREAEPLPVWEGRFLAHLREGLLAMGVIFGYLLPLYAAVALLALARGWVPGAAAAWLAAAFVVAPIFSTLSFPTACLLLARGEPALLSRAECAAFLAAYATLVFLIPAGFLRVSRTGRHRDAFALWHTLPFVARHPGAYVRAWVHSSLMSLLGHLALPWSPWGVVWCYLGILFAFNEVLVVAGQAPGEGWLARALADPTLARSEPGVGTIRDARGDAVRVLDLGVLVAPLPWRPKRVEG